MSPDDASSAPGDTPPPAATPLPAVVGEIEDRLSPAGELLVRHRARAARRRALAAGLALLPRQAGVLAIAFLGATWVLDGQPIPAWSLPVLVLIGWLANAAALFGRDPRRIVDSTQAARAFDAHHGTADRVSAALDLASRGDATAAADSRPAALARLAIDDGLATVRARDAEIALTPHGAGPRLRWSSLILAMVVAALPAALLRDLGSPNADDPRAESSALASDAQEEADTDGEAGTPPSSDDPETERPNESGSERRAEQPSTDRPTPPPGERPPNAEPETRTPRGGGEGGAGSAAAEITPQNTPTSAAASSSAQGDARAGSSGGGGSQGASQSENPPDDRDREPKPPRANRKRPATPRPSETKRGEPEQSAGAPSGPSAGGGRMTAVANERSGLDRGSERDDDTETEDEDVEDEEEESEQRGGVMPSTRDNMQPPSRELSISGDGPPDDGRGGPTPPKKSRGTATLVLGVRLPDQVRGQPNPGTAKTTIEQIPPVPRSAGRKAAEPAPAGAPSPHLQRRPPAGSGADLAEILRRYHEMLKKTSDA